MEKRKTNKKVKKLVSSLPNDAQLSDYWLKVPKKYKFLFEDAGVNTDRIKLVSQWHFGIWIKIDDTDRIYPITGFHNLKDLLKFEIID